MRIEKMFTPMCIGSCEIPNRFVVTAMVTNMCTEDGYATEQYVRYHEAKAKGGYGLIITEDYAVNAHAGGYKNVARIYREDMIEGHRKLTEAVHRHGAKIFCQIYHAGRQSSSKVNGGMPIVNASASSCPLNKEMARELSIDEIQALVKDFGITAGNARRAGFDGVEIHGGNGYLIAAFLSFHQNKRTDRYGGCLDNRVRFLREIYEEVRRAVGDDFPVTLRFSAEEGTVDGRTMAESKVLAKLAEEWGIDAINCSNGVYSSYNLAQVSTSFLPHAWTAENAEKLKKILTIPVIGVNSIDDPLMAEELVEEGVCDFVGMSRCSLADPETPQKAREGRFDEIRPCVRCLQGCIGFIKQQKTIRCLVNPQLGNELRYTFEDQPKSLKILVVGGGPGGMEAAIAASRRGHDVTLWEKADRLGGELLAAVYPPGKGEFATYICYLVRQLELLKVDVKLNEEATADKVSSFGADKIVLATGGLPNMPNVAGIGRPNVFAARDILMGKVQVQGRIVVVGGGEVGAETAMYLADAERGSITVVEMLDGIADKTDGKRIVAIKKFLHDHEVRIMTKTKLIEISETGVILDAEGVKQYLPCDAVVMSAGYHPNAALQTELESLVDKLVVVGDAAQCTNAMEAACMGFEAGYFA